MAASSVASTETGPNKKMNFSKLVIEDLQQLADVLHVDISGCKTKQDMATAISKHLYPTSEDGTEAVVPSPADTPLSLSPHIPRPIAPQRAGLSFSLFFLFPSSTSLRIPPQRPLRP